MALEDLQGSYLEFQSHDPIHRWYALLCVPHLPIGKFGHEGYLSVTWNGGQHLTSDNILPIPAPRYPIPLCSANFVL